MTYVCRSRWFVLRFVLAVGSVPAHATDDERAEPRLELRDGDRIIVVGYTFADNLRRHGYLETLLAARHPRLALTFRNLGWSGDTLTRQPRPLNFGSLDDHLRRQRASVVVACFGMGESFAGEAGLEEFEHDWERLLTHLRSQKFDGEQPPRVVMVSPIAHEDHGVSVIDVPTHNRHLEKYTAVMAEVAQRHGVPFVDLFHPTYDMMRDEPSQKLTENGIHLNDYGYWATGQLTAESLFGTDDAWRVEVDASRGSLSLRGARIGNPEIGPKKVGFEVKFAALPVPAAPAGSIVHSNLSERRPRLVVRGLAEGRYVLKIDGDEVARGDEKAWATGAFVDTTPAHERVERLREAINEKNELFFRRWRPANTEYVFGRRTKPFGSVSFPPEMKKFDELIEQADDRVRELVAPLPKQRWELVPLDD